MGKRLTIWILAAVLGLALCGCSAQPRVRDFYAMDTVMRLQLWCSDAVADEAVELVNSLEQTLSATIPTSEIAQLNQRGSLAVSDTVLELLQSAWTLWRDADGALDISVGPLMELWGFRSGAYAVPSHEALAAALARTGLEGMEIDGSTVTLAQGMELDLGAVAKGYASQRVTQLLAGHGVRRALLNLGGNIQTMGTKADGSPWRIAVTDPEDPSQSVGSLLLEGSNAIVTSGGYQRYFTSGGVRYHHIIDPGTGYPADSGLTSVTIVAESGLMADALSTALFVAGLEKAMEFYQSGALGAFEAVFITSTGAILVTPGLADRFESQREWTVVQP